MARLLLLAAATAQLCAWALGAFSAAHLHWPFLTTALAGGSAQCAGGYGKDVQEIQSKGFGRGVASVSPEFSFYDGARCSKWGGVADARSLIVAGSEMEWEDGALREVGQEAKAAFGGASVAWGEARSGEEASTVVCGRRQVSRVVFVRTKKDGEIRFASKQVTIKSGVLYIFVQEEDGKLCSFSGWTEAPNKRLSVGAVAMDGEAINGGRVAGGVVGVVVLAALLYGATWLAARRAARKEALAEYEDGDKLSAMELQCEQSGSSSSSSSSSLS